MAKKIKPLKVNSRKQASRDRERGKGKKERIEKRLEKINSENEE